MKTTENLMISTSPQIHHPDSTSIIMWTVSLVLLPAGIWGVYVFGLRSLTVLVVSIISAVGAEAVLSALKGRITVFDGSAFLTGLLVGYNMPAAVPLYSPAAASLFAIVVVKWSFGGLGANWMNPALAGRVFVFFSWTGGMTNWTAPKTWMLDSLTAASPLGEIKAGLMDFTGRVSGSLDFLSASGYPVSSFDGRAGEWLLRNFNIELKPGLADLFVGNVPGCIGEVSALLLLAGAAVLFIRKIITWEIPVAYLGTFSLLVWIFGGLRFGNGFFNGDILFHLFSGGLMLGAFYMATDMVTSPFTSKGMIIFGIGVGFLTFLIRFYGSFPEGVSLAIILMNIFVPLINRYTGPKRFGLVKGVKEK